MSENTSYKYLVATDMDYTLVMPGVDVSSKNREAIKALHERGIAFTIATGRTSFLVGKYADELNITVPCITSNGGALYDPIENTDVYSDDLDDNAVKEIIDIAYSRHYDFVGYATEAVYFAPYSKRKFFFEDYNKNTPERLQAKMADFTEEMIKTKSYPKFNKLLVLGADDETVAELKARDDVDAVFSAVDFLDIMNPGSSKGNGLVTLAKRLGIDIANTFAIGDNDNDLSMIESAGHGIAMGNSTKLILDAAEYITSECKEDGFAKAVFDYIIPMVDSLEADK